MQTTSSCWKERSTQTHHNLLHPPLPNLPSSAKLPFQKPPSFFSSDFVLLQRQLSLVQKTPFEPWTYAKPIAHVFAQAFLSHISTRFFPSIGLSGYSLPWGRRHAQHRVPAHHFKNHGIKFSKDSQQNLKSVFYLRNSVVALATPVSRAVRGRVEGRVEGCGGGVCVYVQGREGGRHLVLYPALWWLRNGRRGPLRAPVK